MGYARVIPSHGLGGAQRWLPGPSLAPLPFSQSPLRPGLRSPNPPVTKSSPPVRQARRAVVPVFQMQKLRPREGKQLAEGMQWASDRAET